VADEQVLGGVLVAAQHLDVEVVVGTGGAAKE
jgi:hypothetical protein